MIEHEWWRDEESPLRDAVIATIRERAVSETSQASSPQEQAVISNPADDLNDLDVYGHTGGIALNLYTEAVYGASQVLRASRKIAHLLHIF
jgi:hypothetical protein